MELNFKKVNHSIIFIAIVMAFLSQFYLNTNISNLRISLGIILLPISYYLKDEIQIVGVGLISAIAVYLMRILSYCVVKQFKSYEVIYAIREFFPEIFFYMIYFLIFYYFVIIFKHRKNINLIFIICTMSDFIANISEMLIRSILDYNINNPKEIIGLLTFAVLRSLLIWVIINIIKRYTILLSKKEHEDRYNKLLYTTSKLKTELYWMEKSMKGIEDVMAKAYNLYYTIDSKENTCHLKEVALNIAKDIHEIKKQNMLVLRGLEEIFDDKLVDEGMKLEDIFDILNNSFKSYLYDVNKDIKLHFKLKENINIKTHYYIMSILRNLIMNAVDSIETKGEIDIMQDEYRDNGKEYCAFVVRDNGKGITEENMGYVFSPGFSTKINYETGSVNRGLGLSIVKEIIENTFKGFIELDSEEDKGTKFIVYIPRKELEGE